MHRRRCLCCWHFGAQDDVCWHCSSGVCVCVFVGCVVFHVPGVLIVWNRCFVSTFFLCNYAYYIDGFTQRDTDPVVAFEHRTVMDPDRCWVDWREVEQCYVLFASWKSIWSDLSERTKRQLWPALLVLGRRLLRVACVGAMTSQCSTVNTPSGRNLDVLAWTLWILYSFTCFCCYPTTFFGLCKEWWRCYSCSGRSSRDEETYIHMFLWALMKNNHLRRGWMYFLLMRNYCIDDKWKSLGTRWTVGILSSLCRLLWIQRKEAAFRKKMISWSLSAKPLWPCRVL